MTSPQWDPSQQHTQADPLGAPGAPYQQANPYGPPGYQPPGYPTSPANPYATPGYQPGGPQDYPPQSPYPPAHQAYMAYPAVGPAGETNVIAILALVFAFVFPIAAIVLGHVARHQIRTRGGQGDGLALAGLILGYIFTIITVIVIVIVIAAAATCIHNGIDTCNGA